VGIVTYRFFWNVLDRNKTLFDNIKQDSETLRYSNQDQQQHTMMWETNKKWLETEGNSIASVGFSGYHFTANLFID